MTTVVARKLNSTGPEDYTGADPGDDDCAGCQLYTSPGYLNCDQCGIRLQPSADWPEMTGPAVNCPADGAGMPLDARFCGYCGRTIPGQAHAEAYEATTPAVTSSSGRQPCPCGCGAPAGEGWDTARGRSDAAWLRAAREQQAQAGTFAGAGTDTSPAARAAFLEDVCDFAPRVQDGGGWIRDLGAAEDDEARSETAFEDAALAMRDGWSQEAARAWEEAGRAWEAARDRAAAARASFDQLSQPYAGMPPTEAGPDSGQLLDDEFPDLRLPTGADYNALDVRGRARW
jgi:hypothetical protein